MGSLLPDGIGSYEASSMLPLQAGKEQLEEAAKLLTQAGYPGGKGFPPLEVIYNTSENHKKIAVVLQQFWKENLGIEIRLHNLEWRVYLDRMQSKDFQIARQGGCSTVDDASDLLLWFKGGNRRNFHNWASKNYDSLVSKGMAEVDLKKRNLYYKQAETILLQELPIIPIYHYVQPTLVGKQVLIRSGDSEDFQPWVGNPFLQYSLKYFAIGKQNG